jgi:D-3-phosphoglycerate dehydrogenase
MNISLLEPIGVPVEMIEEFEKSLKKEGHVFTYYHKKTTDVSELKKRSENQDIVMIANNPYPNEVIRECDQLKMIAVAFTGIDHVGLEACREKKIEVLNCAGYSNQSVAELAVGMAVGVMRKILEGNAAVGSGKTSAGLTGTEICGKTVGIVGCGQIGFKTAKLFKAFGAEVLAYSRHEKEEWKEAGIQYAQIDQILAESDIVSLHLPLNDSTRGFFDREKIGSMKQDSILINCARGPIIDNGALAEALNNGQIAGAAIDVFDMEPPIPADYPLLHAKNVLLTPHVAFLTKEAMVRRAEIEFQNVISYLHGKAENVCEF